MLAGRPILLLADTRSESAIELGKSEAGCTIGVRSSAAVLEGMNALLAASSDRLETMGINGRRYAQEFYSANQAVTKLNTILEAAYEA
ncbi:hypothetical protein D9M73_274530 [compost metagenome]